MGPKKKLSKKKITTKKVTGGDDAKVKTTERKGDATFTNVQDGSQPTRVGEIDTAKQKSQQALINLKEKLLQRFDIRKKPVNGPLSLERKHDLPINEDNDYGDLSMKNIIATLHPERPANKKIISKFDPDNKNTATFETQESEQLYQHQKSRSIALGGSVRSSVVTSQAAMTPKPRFRKTKDVMRRQPIFKTHVNGQLLEAPEQVDNWAQADNFFSAVNENVLYQQHKPSLGYKFASITEAKRKRLEGSPLVERPTLGSLEPLPRPGKKVRKLLEEAAHAHHDSSSEDDLMIDENFKSKAKHLTRDLISQNIGLSQMEQIEESIREHKYEVVRQRGELAEDTLYVLGFKSRDDPVDRLIRCEGGDLPKILQTNKLGQALLQSQIERKTQSELLNVKYNSRQTMNKLLKASEADNNKRYDLAGQSIHDRQQEAIYFSDEDEKNCKRTGLPQIKKFYHKFRQLDKRIQLDQGQQSSTIAYMKKAGALPMVVKPTIGLTAHKGNDNEINMNDGAIGDLQAEALGEAIKYAKQEKIYACNNRLSQEGALHIIEAITGMVKELNLSDNDLMAHGKNQQINMIDYLEKKETHRKNQLERFRQIRAGILNAESITTDDTRNSTELGIRTQDKRTSIKLESLLPGGKKRPSVTALSTLSNTVSPDKRRPSKITEIASRFQSSTALAEDDEELPHVELPKCIEQLGAHLENTQLNLQALFLNNCGLGDDAVGCLLNGLVARGGNKKLIKLYLNKNHLTNRSGEKIAQMLLDGLTRLKELGLKWNKLNAVSGNKIAAALEINDCLKVLDLAWNKLGQKPSEERAVFKKRFSSMGVKPMKQGEIGAAWGACMRENKYLVHLDMSFNQIDWFESQLIMEQLVDNNTLVGLHFQGNKGVNERLAGKIDSQGFMRQIDTIGMLGYDTALEMCANDGRSFATQKRMAKHRHLLGGLHRAPPDAVSNMGFSQLPGFQSDNQSRTVSNRPSALSQLAHQPLRNYRSMVDRLQNCWICEQWVECEFNLDLKKAMLKSFGEEITLSEDTNELCLVFIHFDFDDYMPDRMDDQRLVSTELSGRFKCHRMVPQGQFHYFFSYNGRAFLNPAIENVPINYNIQKEIIEKLKAENEFDVNIADEFDLNELNIIDSTVTLQKKLIEMMNASQGGEEKVVSHNLQTPGASVLGSPTRKVSARGHTCYQDETIDVDYTDGMGLTRRAMRLLDSHRKADGKVVVDWEDEDSHEDCYSPGTQEESIQRHQLLGNGQEGMMSQLSRFSNDVDRAIKKTDSIVSIVLEPQRPGPQMPEGVSRLNTAMINERSPRGAMENTFGAPRNNVVSSSVHLQEGVRGSQLSDYQLKTPFKSNTVDMHSDYPADPPDYHVMEPDTYEIKLQYCSIRPNKSLKQQRRAETPWKVEIGVFKEYLKERKASLIVQCFEHDWASMKVLKYKKSTDDEVKKEMARVYPLLKDCYRCQAGYGPAGNVFSIGQNQILQFMQEILHCLDQDHLKGSDVDRMMITVNAMKSGPYNPANQLVRHQFMEFIIRCAMEKYFAAGTVDNELAAIKKFNDEFIIPKCKGYSQDKWRQDHTFNVEVDNVMKAYSKLWTHIYSKYSGKHSLPGQKPFMMQDEFEAFVIDSGMINDGLAQREIPLIFNLSMLTQVDEIDKGRHLEARPIEFMEMITRCADESSLPPNACPKGEANEGEDEESDRDTMPLAQRQAQPLSVKIENAIHLLFQTVCDRKFKASFKHPVKDTKRNLYVLPNGKFF